MALAIEMAISDKQGTMLKDDAPDEVLARARRVVENRHRESTEAMERANPDVRRSEAEERYFALFNAIDQGFCTLDVAFDDQDTPVDYRFVEVSPSFARQTGIENGAGRWMRDIAATQDDHWFQIYGRVALTGQPERFEEFSTPLDRWWYVYAFRIQDPHLRRVAVLFSDVTDRKRAEEDMRAAAQRKDEFIAMLAHELRNPLAPIRTGLELIRLAGDSKEAVERVRTLMDRQVAHMVRLIDDLLDVSRISAGKIQLKREATPLSALVGAAIDANRPAATARALTIEVALPEAPCCLDVDPMRFTQVLSNLLHNSTKFTHPGGTIRVSAEIVATAPPAAAQVKLRISDTGIGISAELLPHVFELFVQGDRGSSDPGLGIGLALSRRLVEMHGGRITARSSGPGRGSDFELELPRTACDPVQTTSTAASMGTLQRRIVVVDDNEDAANTMAMVIDEIGGTPFVAYNGEDGVRLVLEHRPDIVLLDLGMQPLDGYATCRRVRREMGRDVIIIALTGWGQTHEKQRALEAGFDGHLTKPADVTELERILSNKTWLAARHDAAP
jgi:signal transduction histidine kinase/ActR/RegA family two-component response regulator